MKLSSLIFTAGVFASTVSAFSPAVPSQNALNKHVVKTPSTQLGVSSFGQQQGMMGMIDVVNDNAPRDVYAMEQWATDYGVQKVDGVELYTADGSDYQLITQAPIPFGSTVIYVPANLCFGSDAVVAEYGGSLEAAEYALIESEKGLGQRLPLFRLMVKILGEYDKGQESNYFPWLNAMPRFFSNGVSMTDACFECLPPYAKLLAMNERNAYSRFVNALRKGYVPINANTLNDDRIVKWAYNVALTRFHEIWQPSRQKMMAPMADMLNHSTDPNCEISFAGDGSCTVMATRDIQPGTPLTVSLGSPTNPTPLFAKYGFLYDDCKTIFCKAVHLEDQIQALGYDYNDLLIQTESGDIAPAVWDVFLYAILQQNDPAQADQFYMAVKMNDEATKKQFQDSYFAYTLGSLKEHIYSILGEVDSLTMKAQSYDLNTHPRVPVIVAHNNLVRSTFTMTANLLEQMG